MHLLLSLKLNATTFQVLPINLNGSRKVETGLKNEDVCTKDSLLDIYAKRIIYQQTFPGIMNMNFITFSAKYKISKGKLMNQSQNIVPRIFPNYSPNPKGDKYSLYCKYQLLKYKPWQKSPNNAWENEIPDDHTFIVAWRDFLHSPFAKQHVPEWENKLQHVLDNIQQTNETPNNEEIVTQEEWMLISDFHNSNKTFKRNI